MSDTRPQPLVPPEVDLRDFAFMPVEVRRLLTSDTWILGNGDERAAAVALWLESWHQIPAGSLPNDVRALQHLSQSRVPWKKVSGHAMRGWVECNDGRLYHPVVCEKVLEGWLEKLAQRISSGQGNAKRWGMVFDRDQIEGQMQSAREMLAALNPQSRSLTKKRTAQVHRESRTPPDRNPNGTKKHPDGNPTGSPDGNPDAVPMHSQDKGTGTVPPSPPLALSHPVGKEKPRRQKRERLPTTQAPDSFEVTDELAAWAVAQGLPEDRIELETLKMLNHYQGKGEPRSNWTATWRNWILKAIEINGRRAA